MEAGKDSAAAVPAQASAPRRGQREVPLKYLVPLAYAPVLPIIRIALRKHPRARAVVFGTALTAALGHGIYLLAFDSSVQ
eukprot:m.55629 g.55629  ORF g.55629 m.55629 type:complete len:80 (-) comp13327_c0_seq1:592-831(-)